MEYQEVKVAYGDNLEKEVFFWQHSFKSAYTHANEFVNRLLDKNNKTKIRVYFINTSPYRFNGKSNKWVLYNEIN